MSCITRVLTVATAVAVLALGPGGIATSASAATYNSTGTCLVTDVSPTASACFGTVLPIPANDSASLLNSHTFGTDTGLFNLTNWSFLAKYENPDGGAETNGLTVSGNTWSFAGSLFYEAVAIILKQGNTFSAYLFDGGLASTGTWSTPGFGQGAGGLSHMSIYTSGNPTSPIPLPAAGWLMLAGLGGLVAVRRRRKSG